MAALENKIDFAVVFASNNANPTEKEDSQSPARCW